MANDMSAAVDNPARVCFELMASSGMLFNVVRLNITHDPITYVNIIILGSSAFMGGIIANSTPITKPWRYFAADISLAILSFIVLAYTRIRNPGKYDVDTILVAYSSWPLAINMIVHIYSALCMLWSTHKVQHLVRKLVAKTPHESPDCDNQSGAHDEEKAIQSPTTENQEETHGIVENGSGSSSA